jgi:hypothetical protein
VRSRTLAPLSNAVEMKALRPLSHNPKREAGPRLVLITELEPARTPDRAPLRIIGAEPRTGGGFRLTDR